MPEEEEASKDELMQVIQMQQQQIEQQETKPGTYGSPTEEEKHNVHTFLHKVSISEDTTKTGNLVEEEIGFTPYSIRTYKQLSVICDKLCNDDLWRDYFKIEGEILTATSLSREGFLVKQATTQTRQIADITRKPMTSNKGWFKPKEKVSEGGGQ